MKLPSIELEHGFVQLNIVYSNGSQSVHHENLGHREALAWLLQAAQQRDCGVSLQAGGSAWRAELQWVKIPPVHPGPFSVVWRLAMTS